MPILLISRPSGLAGSLIGLLSMAFTAVVAAQTPTPREAPPLQVGVPILGEPLAYYGEAGEAAGLLVEYWRMAQRELGSVRVHLCQSAPDCLADLEAGVLDLVGPMGIVAEGGAVAFSPPVLSLPIAAASRAPLEQDPRLLRGARVGLMRGLGGGSSPLGDRPACARDNDCAPLQRWSPREVIHQSAQQVDASVIGADVDVLVGPRASLIGALASESRIEFVPLWRRWLYVAARNGEEARLRQVHEALLAISPAGLSAIAAFGEAFGDVEALAAPMDVPELSHQEKLFLDRHPAVYLGAAVWEPLTVLDGDDVTGLGIDSVRFHLERLGVTAVFEVGEWSRMQTMANESLLDGLGFVVSSRNFINDRFLFTGSVVDAPFVAAIGPSAPFVGAVDEIASLDVVVNREYTSLLQAIESTFPGIELSLVEGADAAIEAVEQGRAQAWLEFLPVVRYAVANSTSGSSAPIRTMGTGLFQSMSTALDPSLSPLVTLIDRSIEETPVGLVSVQSRWLDVARPAQGGAAQRGIQLALVLLSALLAGGCVHLILQRVRERARLHASEAALRRAQLLSGVGSLEVPPPYNRVLLTGDTGHLLGLPAGISEQGLDEHLGLFCSEDAARLDQALEAAWRTGYGNTVALKAGEDEDARRYLYEFSPPQRTELHPASVLITLRDVTDQSRAEERERALENEVVELQKLDAVGRLAASIAHDFNNVLSVVMGSAELALRHLPKDHPANSPVQQVVTAGLRSRELIGQMLNSVRPPARERQRFSLREVVSDTLGLLSHGVPANVSLVSALGDQALYVDGNDVQVRQVVGNLIRNAVDAMPGGGELSVQLGRMSTSLGDRALLSVADTGVGMSEDTLANCFEFFYTTRTEGTGLGLAIVRSLVTSHRGRVEVSSQLGQGTTFKVWLPLASDQQAAAPPGPASLPALAGLGEKAGESGVPASTAEVAPTPTPALSSSAPHLLLVDDERDLLSAVSSGLRARGFRVTAVVGADAALDTVDRHRAAYDIVLTDLTMPGMSGIELAQELKRREPRLPVVLLAAGSEDPQALGGSRHIDRVLDKQISNDELCGALGELVYGYAAS